MSNEGRKAHLVGSGIANLAAAAYLIKDGGFSGANIKIYEEETLPGGSLDSAGAGEKGYFMRGERMFEENYVCMCDLLSFIPSLDDPAKTVKQDTIEFSNTFLCADAWYMNDAASLAYAAEAPNFGRITLPALFIHATNDDVFDTTRSRLADPMREDCANLTEVTIEGGHAIMLERSAA